MQKELANLKKAKKDEKAETMVKEVDHKLGVLEKSRKEHLKTLNEDLETLKQVDFEDFTINHDVIKRVRKFKISVDDVDSKLKDAEELQNEVVRILSEKDIENSSNILGAKAQDLRERLSESKA
jgi:hypothetical protein